MHNSRLTPAAAIPASAPEPPKCTLHQGGVRFIWRYRKSPLTGQEGPNHDRRPQARLHPLRPLAWRSRCVLRGKPQIRHRNPARAGAGWRSGAPGGGGGPLHRQERHDARHRGAYGTQAAAARRGRDRQGQRAQAQGRGQARRHCHGQGAGGGRGGHDLCRVRLGRAQGRSGRRPGAGCTAARLYVRPLQDQAQRRRQSAEKGRGEFRLRQSGGGGKGLGQRATAIADGVVIARDLVNEPANVLYPGRIRPPRLELEQARRRRRGARRRGDEEARHGRAARRRPGLGA